MICSVLPKEGLEKKKIGKFRRISWKIRKFKISSFPKRRRL
uniref:Uncharacterized protein n=1 Tax=Anopheles atroparvus TaxID=41427 RepID=A0AAG5DMM0_ANOAO